MTNLFLGTILFSSAVLAFGLAFLALRRPGAGGDGEVLVSLFVVGLTALFAYAVSAFAAFGLAWADEIAALGSTMALGLGLANLGALVVAGVLVRIGRRIAVQAPMADVLPFTPGAPQPPANSPRRRKLRAAA